MIILVEQEKNHKATHKERVHVAQPNWSKENESH